MARLSEASTGRASTSCAPPGQWTSCGEHGAARGETGRAAWMCKSHHGQPLSKNRLKRLLVSEGFHVQYFSDETQRSRKGRFDLRNVLSLRQSNDTDVAYGVDVLLSESASIPPKHTKTLVVDFGSLEELAAWLRLWTSAVDPSRVEPQLLPYRDVQLARTFNASAGDAPALLSTMRSFRRGKTPLLSPRAKKEQHLGSGQLPLLPLSSAAAAAFEGGALPLRDSGADSTENETEFDSPRASIMRASGLDTPEPSLNMQCSLPPTSPVSGGGGGAPAEAVREEGAPSAADADDDPAEVETRARLASLALVRPEDTLDISMATAFGKSVGTGLAGPPVESAPVEEPQHAAPPRHPGRLLARGVRSPLSSAQADSLKDADPADFADVVGRSDSELKSIQTYREESVTRVSRRSMEDAAPTLDSLRRKSLEPGGTLTRQGSILGAHI